ncbi:MAG: class B sortase [Ruminiclostridium sp.]|nr:class B sortase [Ruminiclostridium sp.]
MAGFAKRPHRKASGHVGTEKKFEMPDDKEENSVSYITPGLFGDDDDDDLPDTRKRGRKRRTVYDDDDEFEEKKKPNIFVRALHAIFPVKGDGVGESVRKIIFDIAVVAFIITGGSVLHDVLNEAGNVIIVDKEISDLHDTGGEDKTEEEKIKIIQGKVNISDAEVESIKKEKPGIQVDFLGLYSQNSDIVGWIHLGSENDKIVNIDYPVVQAEDNDYYLTHNFKREEAPRGAIFADYRNKFNNGELSGNTVLYGHNMWTGDTMFAKLSRYYDGGVPKGETKDYMEFYRNHPTIEFDTLYENAQWKVFACVLFNTQEELGEVYPYINVRDFANADEFNTFILDIMDRSVMWTDVDLQYGDNILTLSTCYYPYGKENADTRVAVFARKVREGESAEVDVSKAMRNPDPLMFAYEYRVHGGSWGGRKWDSSKLLSYNG